MEKEIGLSIVSIIVFLIGLVLMAYPAGWATSTPDVGFGFALVLSYSVGLIIWWETLNGRFLD